MPTTPRTALSPIRALRDELRALFADMPDAAGREGRVAVDVVDEPRSVEIRIDVLGLGPDSLEVEVDGDMLRLRGSRVVEDDFGSGGSRNRRRRRWHFVRAIQIPPELRVETADATYDHGLLTVKLRKR